MEGPMRKSTIILSICLILAIVCAAFFGFKYSALVNQDIVYISFAGECYHADPQCSNMYNPVAVTLEQAQGLYRTPCEICTSDLK